MRRFLIVNPFGIGDVLFTTPLIKALKESYPDSLIAYWCNERVEALLRNNPQIDRIFALSRGDLKRVYSSSWLKGARRFIDLFLWIKQGHFDLSFDFSLDHRYALILKLAGVRRRIGFNYKGRGRFLTDRIDIEAYHSRHVVEYYLDLLGFLDIKAQDKRLSLVVPEKEKAKVKNILSGSGIRPGDIVVGIAPGAGASWGKDAGLKQWPIMRFARLSDSLIEGLGARIVILGDKADIPLAEEMTSLMKDKPLNLVGKTSLGEFIAAVGSLNLLITNDGGPLHIAVALGVKTVSIFGPVSEITYGPFPPGPGHTVLKKDIPCRPCYKQFRMPLCDKEMECLRSISPDEVYNAVRRLL